jgi:hypothetical protein
MSSSVASELARHLARHAEAVCRRYLSNGRREGRYWLVGNVRNEPGRSLFVRLSGPDCGKGAAGKWVDGATAERGDLLDIIRETCRLNDFRDVVSEARQFLNAPQPAPDPSSKEARTKPTQSGSSDSARRLFAMSRPIAGTLAEKYLRHRSITAFHDAASLRFHPHCYYRSDNRSPIQTWPAMIAAVTDLDGKLTGAQRTWLDPSGEGKAPIETPRRAMGSLLGHGVRFGLADDIMAAGEGIETVLSLRCIMPAMPMMAALSSAHLSAILFPTTVRRLYVVRDNDPAGVGAATTLVERATAAGIEAIVLSPVLDDFNDDLRRLGVDELRAAIRGQITPEDVDRFMGISA